MKLSEYLLRHYLDHVYWVCGGPCGGKSTMTDILATKWDMEAYHSDDSWLEHRDLASPSLHPLLVSRRGNVDWEAYFMTPVEEQITRLNAGAEEQLEFIIFDLLELRGTKRKVIADTFASPAFLEQLAPPERIVYLFAEEELIRSDYLERHHVSGMKELFPTLSDPVQAEKNTFETVTRISSADLEIVKNSGFKYFVRDRSTTLDTRLRELENHFGF